MSRLSILFAAILVAASPTFAHGLMQRATPMAGEALKQGPAAIVLEFSEPLAAGSDIAVTDQKGRLVPAGKAVFSGKTLTLKLPPLQPGIYRVRWHAVSVDTHKTQGSYPFRIVP
ncbi:MAG: copper resistance protein CopC [Proteobacteria bacterium]|nr:copper resistance protein CopC [Pseudomonadota bacterium]